MKFGLKSNRIFQTLLF